VDSHEDPDFHPIMNGIFLARHGPAYGADVSYCRDKLCFVATDQSYLREVLLELSRDPECYFVKYDTRPRSGMYRGRCFFLSLNRVGETWAHYKGHPQLLCSVQSDTLTDSWRSQVRDWSQSEDASGP